MLCLARVNRPPARRQPRPPSILQHQSGWLRTDRRACPPLSLAITAPVTLRAVCLALDTCTVRFSARTPWKRWTWDTPTGSRWQPGKHARLNAPLGDAARVPWSDRAIQWRCPRLAPDCPCRGTGRSCTSPREPSAASRCGSAWLPRALVLDRRQGGRAEVHPAHDFIVRDTPVRVVNGRLDFCGQRRVIGGGFVRLARARPSRLSMAFFWPDFRLIASSWANSMPTPRTTISAEPGTVKAALFGAECFAPASLLSSPAGNPD